MTISNNDFTHNSGSEQSGGIKNIRIDFTAIAGITDAHLRIAEALQFPDHYGKNLDALFDCLAEICNPVAVTLCRPRQLREHDAARVFGRGSRKPESFR